jgi:O-acetyl-ADP-ribose deacetylase (regulator of RNase III)
MKTIKGDLLDFPEGITVIFHQANTHAMMGAGIAGQIRTRYPEAAKADRDAFNGHQAKLGLFSGIKLSDEPPRVIINLYGQENISTSDRQTDYEGLYVAMDRAMSVIAKRPNKDDYIIGVPKGMGCGLGGGDWRIVEAMLEVLSEKYSLEVRIVEL